MRGGRRRETYDVAGDGGGADVEPIDVLGREFPGGCGYVRRGL
jgi:hypothetical protein